MHAQLGGWGGGGGVIAPKHLGDRYLQCMASFIAVINWIKLYYTNIPRTTLPVFISVTFSVISATCESETPSMSMSVNGCILIVCGHKEK